MTAQVLMHKRTGKIVEGHKVWLSNGINWDYFGRMTIIEHDGWIIYHPSAGPFSYFINRKFVERDFEELGEL